jgi:hypothetical protein
VKESITVNPLNYFVRYGCVIQRVLEPVGLAIQEFLVCSVCAQNYKYLETREYHPSPTYVSYYILYTKVFVPPSKKFSKRTI